VEERFQQVDHDRLELTVTIDDPKMYTKPWIAMISSLSSCCLRIRESLRVCSPGDQAKYNKGIEKRVNGTAGK
jgi:hypothetical protein